MGVFYDTLPLNAVNCMLAPHFRFAQNPRLYLYRTVDRCAGLKRR